MRFSRSATSFALVASALLAACGGSDSSGPPKVAQVVLSGLVTQVEVGATIQFVATPRDAKGNALVGRSATWTSSAPATASVDQSGVVSGLLPGGATISVAIDGVSATQQVTVTPVPVVNVVIDNRTPSVREGGTVQLSALTQDAIGRVLPGRPVTWSSANAVVATVSATGLVSGLTPGSTYIRA